MKEKIKEYTEKLTTVKLAVNNAIKIKTLEQEIKRYIAKELKTTNTIEFTSHDLRILIAQLKKIHKRLNDLIDFSTFKKKFNKYEKVSTNEIKIEIVKVVEYMRCARDLQEVYSKLCYDEVILDFIEMQKEQSREENEKALSEAILQGLSEAII